MPENDWSVTNSLDESGVGKDGQRLSTVDRFFLVLLAISCLGNALGPLMWIFVFQNSSHDFVGSFLAGLLLSQFAAIAYWATSSPLTTPIRILVVFMVGFLLAVFVVVGCYAWPGMPLVFALAVIITGGLFGFVNWGMLALWDRFSHLQVVARDGTLRTRSQKHQYGILYLLGWMTAIAVGILVTKLILPSKGLYQSDGLELLFLPMWFAWLMVSVSSLSLLNRNSILSGGRYYIAITILVFLLGPYLFQVVASWLFFIIAPVYGFPLSGEYILMAYLVEAGLVTGCSLCAFLMRWNGYRLVKSRLSELAS